MEIGMSRASMTKEVFYELKNANIKHIEISLSMEKINNLDFQEVKELAEETGVNLWSFHLPFMPFAELDISNPNIAEKTVAYLKEIIKKAAGIGIDKFVIHASGEPIAEEDRRVRMDTAKNSLKELCEYADSFGAIIIVENLPRTCLGRDSSDILELLSVDPRLKSCFDTNHLLKENSSDYIKAVGEKIVTTHVSDYDFKDERHWLPGEGKIDWQRLYGDLKSVGFDGAWLYELNLSSTKTIDREKDLTAFDVYENATSIFEGKALFPKGKVKENL